MVPGGAEGVSFGILPFSAAQVFIAVDQVFQVCPLLVGCVASLVNQPDVASACRHIQQVGISRIAIRVSTGIVHNAIRTACLACIEESQGGAVLCVPYPVCTECAYDAVTQIKVGIG